MPKLISVGFYQQNLFIVVKYHVMRFWIKIIALIFVISVFINTYNTKFSTFQPIFDKDLISYLADIVTISGIVVIRIAYMIIGTEKRKKEELYC